jgi:hypothetical protein
MAKRSIILPPLPTEEEIMTIQPNNVTFGQYAISEIQENLLTLAIDAIQKDMSNVLPLPRDLFNQPYIIVNCDPAGGKNHKARVLKEAMDFKNKVFSFRWTHPGIGEMQTEGVIFPTIHNPKGTNQLYLNLNLWAIPFLLYYGMGIGGTLFQKTIALILRGNYTKRLYKIICSQRSKKEYFYSIEQFRKDLGIPENYRNCDIETKVLKPASERIRESKSDVVFDYRMVSQHPTKGRKPKADAIVFTITNRSPKSMTKEELIQFDEKHNFVLRFINRALEFPTNDSVELIMKVIVADGRIDLAYARATYYDDKLSTGEMTKALANNSFMKFIREEFNINIEKKSGQSEERDKVKKWTSNNSKKDKTPGSLFEK